MRSVIVCLSRNDELQASKFLAKAVQADPSNIQIHQNRCELLESMAAQKELLKACLTMLRCVQPENEQKRNEWVELAVRIARMHHASGQLYSARRTLSNALVLTKHCGLVFNNKKVDAIDLEEAETMELTQELPLDILSKLCIALVYSKKHDFAFPLIETFLEYDVESFGDTVFTLTLPRPLWKTNFTNELCK
ncbi:hypothetical protein OUZ56_012882 [Daphnia magna]|uniref:TPR_REGION domain-containing protein n=1 Tax=Daphnia magna TaxID=35525 RepID=A0ABQ9Z4A4_9CRUS|nr:hypothetical protein OUZ56_012882 [Daphnia magna]